MSPPLFTLSIAVSSNCCWALIIFQINPFSLYICNYFYSYLKQGQYKHMSLHIFTEIWQELIFFL